MAKREEQLGSGDDVLLGAWLRQLLGVLVQLGLLRSALLGCQRSGF